MHGWAEAALGSWGRSSVLWQGQRFLQPLLLPQNCSRQENGVAVVAGQGLVPTGS